MNSKEKKYENMTPLEALEWIDAYSEDDVYHNITNEVNIIKKALSRLEQLEKELKDGTLSDGYHTFNDLYLQRMYLFATIVNQNKQLAWKSLKHEDGELCFGGDWFIVGIDTPKGSYTYHYETNYWILFDCKELEVAKHWDGHTSKDVDRLLSLHHDAFDQLEKQVITLIEEKNKLAKQVKKQLEEYHLLEKEVEVNQKELKQTKLNFKNSQTRSKNCYKKLKEKYEKLEKDNQALRKAIENSNKADDVLMQNSNIQFLNQNQEIYKLKKAWDILKNKNVNLETFNISADLDTYHEILKDNPFYDKLTQEEYELLKEVLGCE